MKSTPLVRIAAFGCMLFWQVGLGQDLVITNARIIDGTALAAERGTVVVADGRIVSVAEGNENITASAVIDAKGMTVMPGLINTHWHLLSGVFPSPDDASVEQYIDSEIRELGDALLARGVTTILSAGDLYPDILELRRRLADGEMRGPRLLVVGPVFTAPGDWPTPLCRGSEACKAKYTAQLTDPEEARAKVREVAAAGVDALKLVYDDLVVPTVRLDDAVVAAITAEAQLHDLTVYAHISTVKETALSLVELGIGGLVHPVPFRTNDGANGASILQDLNIPVATTVSVRAPEWRVFAKLTYTKAQQAGFEKRLEDIRHLWDKGVAVAFGTDTTTRLGGHGERFWAEARALNQVLSNQELITALTRNGAIFLGLGDELGTLEPGKIADMILLDGDPLADISNLSRVAVVIQGGRVVVDHR